MTHDRDTEKERWVMTGWSSLCAVLLMSVLFFSIYEMHTAQSRDEAPPYATEATGERLLY